MMNASAGNDWMATTLRRRSAGRCAAWATILLGAFAVTTAAADLEFAHGLYRQQRYALAADEYRAILAANPGPAAADEASFYLAESLLQLGKLDEAALLYDRLAAKPERPDDRRRISQFRAAQLRADANPANASDRLQQFLKEYPQDPFAPQAHALLGDAMVKLQRLDEADAQYDRALALRPKETLVRRIRLQQAKLWARRERRADAAKAFEQIARGQDGADVEEALLELGVVRHQAGDPAGALAAFDQLLRRFPQSSLADAAGLNQGICLAQLGRSDEAENIWKNLAGSNDPKKVRPSVAADAWMRLGSAQSERGELKKGSNTLRQGAAKFPDEPVSSEMLFAAALADRKAGELEAAITTLRQLTTRKPPFGEPSRLWYTLCRAELDAGLLADARADYRKLATDFPKSAEKDLAAVAVARALVADPKAPDRRSAVEELLQGASTPSSKSAIQYLAALLRYESKQYEEALSLLHSAEGSLDADLVVDAAVLRGLCAVRLHRWKPAVEALAPVAAKAAGEGQASALQSLGLAVAELPADPQTATLEKLLEELASSRPDAVALLTLLAEQRYDRQRYDAAKRFFQRILTVRPEPKAAARAKLAVGWCLYEQKDPAGALEQFLAAAGVSGAEEKTLAEAHYMAGAAAQELGKDADAVREYEKTASSYPSSDYAVDAAKRAARLLAKAGDSKNAVRMLEPLVQRTEGSPMQVGVLDELAWLSLAGGDKDRAEKLFAQIVDKHPDSPAAQQSLLKLAELAQDRGRWDQAKSRLDQLAARPHDPSLDAPLLYRQGLGAFETGKLDAAESFFTRLLDQFPQHALRPAAIYWLGETLLQRQRYDDAARRYRELLAGGDGAKYENNARLRLAQALLDGKQSDAAFDAAEECLAKVQDSAVRGEALLVQGRVRQRQARFDEAREKFAQILAGEKTECAAKAQLMIGESYFHQQRYADALKAFLKVDILYPFPQWQSLALLEVGKCHEKLGERNEAVAAYQSLLKRFPTSSLAGQAKERLGALDRTEAAR